MSSHRLLANLIVCVLGAVCAFAQPVNRGLYPPSLKVDHLPEGKYRVTFSYDNPEVSDVFLAGSFNDWNRNEYRMGNVPTGVFTATVVLEEGEYDYAFYVDNKGYRADPMNTLGTTDTVRGRVSTLRLGAPKPVLGDNVTSAIAQFVRENSGGGSDKLFPARTKLVSAKVTSDGLSVALSGEAVSRPWRTDSVVGLKARLTEVLPEPIAGEIKVTVDSRQLEEYVPPTYRPEPKPREGATTAPPALGTPLRRNASSVVPEAKNGLGNRNIVVWPSHGWLYDGQGRKRWEWQRPRMFTTVEDLLTVSMINPYLLPMLENAGAFVFCCRERDTQLNEVVLDDEDGTSPLLGTFRIKGATSAFKVGKSGPQARRGFRNGLAPYADGVVPHQMGFTHEAAGHTKPTATAQWSLKVPADGEYAVYVSYASSPDSADDAHYTVHHAGGSSEFLINQRMAGNTWVYLSTFSFCKGGVALVELTNQSATSGARISADAVKLGGGMGNVLKDGKVSGYPRFAEGARYWFPYAGIDPKALYAFGSFAGKEYTEDYVSRSEFANYLVGAPRGPGGNPQSAGLNVPVDLSFALHTDAGISTGVIGTLSIHTLKGEQGNEMFPDGRSRMLCRDLGDLIQTQIVDDIRALYSSSWTRRDLTNRSYAESRRPNLPCVLIELLSHQNYDDMKFALDPRFKFDVARAIYKGMLKFLATEYGFEAVVQPLAPTHLRVRSTDESHVEISWRAKPDPLEPTAKSDGFVVYHRTGDAGFDNGTKAEGTDTTSVVVEVPKDPSLIHSFRVTAYNSGGESMPSEILATCAGKPGGKRALIVNAFDRICAPEMITGDSEGVARHIDRGVGDRWSVGLAGDQYDFNRSHAWLGNDTVFTNDNPGHGATSADMETTRELGNTFDFVVRHGRAFFACGWAFDSVSDEALEAEPGILGGMRVVDWVLGEERTQMPPPATDGQAGAADRMKPAFQAWPATHQRIVRDYLNAGGRLMVSGAYVASDLVVSPLARREDLAFLKDVLKCAYVTDHASRTNRLVQSATTSPLGAIEPMQISRGLGEDGVYGVENPGGIDGLPKEAPAILRYEDGYVGAAVASDKNGRRVVLAFPFECIVGESARVGLLRDTLRFLDQ